MSLLKCDPPENDGLNWRNRSQIAAEKGDEELFFSSRADCVVDDKVVEDLGFVLTEQAVYILNEDVDKMIRRIEITTITDVYLFDTGFVRLESTDGDAYFRTTLLPREIFVEAFTQLLPHMKAVVVDDNDKAFVSELPASYLEFLLEPPASLKCDPPENDGLNWRNRSQIAAEKGDEELFFSSRADCVVDDKMVEDLGFVLTEQAVYILNEDVDKMIRRIEITTITDVHLFDTGFVRMKSKDGDAYFRTTLLPREIFAEALTQLLPQIVTSVVDEEDPAFVSDLPEHVLSFVLEPPASP
eukprot:TRINITY_DN17270_c0_g2_i1.p2 TRINITY_DN17270_c0_g2~~TRINITY_DN17270_c0_g2_i1.p2  ORF type:complete len:299 (+),score=89.34 TRINITY_DN17270_c0_g2_i1:1220-2116(+)